MYSSTVWRKKKNNWYIMKQQSNLESLNQTLLSYYIYLYFCMELDQINVEIILL